MFRRTLPALLLAALTLACLATPVQAQGDQTLRITGHDDDTRYYFTVQGLDGENPPIRLRPGSNVTVEFTNEGPNETHNVRFGAPIDRQTDLIQPGENRTMQFTVPEDADGTAEYWCDPHRQLGMAGELRYEAPGGQDAIDSDADDGVDVGEEDEEPENGSPGPGLLLVLAALAAAAVVRRR